MSTSAEPTNAAQPVLLLRKLSAFIESATRTLAQSIAPEPDEAWLTAAQLNLYRASTGHTPWLMPIAVLLVSVAVSRWVDVRTRTIWVLTVAIVCVLLELIERRLDRTLGRDLAGIRARATWFTLINSVFLLAWCSMALCLWVPTSTADHMMLVLVLACSLAGSVSATAMHPALAVTCVAIHAAFILGPTVTSPNPLDRTLAGLSMVYVLLLTGQFAAAYQSTTKMLRLEHEREALVGDLRAAKAESDRSRTRAIAAGQAKSQFLSHMSHELRTPMNAILGFSEMIRNRAFGDSVERYAEYAGIIHDSGQTLLALINGVLDLAKIDGGKLSLRETDFDLARLVHDAIEQGEIRATEANVTLAASVGCDLLWVHADERAIRQILANLLSNAIKFTPSGGHATVFAHREADGRVAFGVEDNGIGMAPDDQAQAFERFGRGRHDVTTADRGTGLGLAIVKGFAEAHDGDVTLESDLGVGTRVTAFLPADRVCAPAPNAMIA
jgi:two-component system cell cycle sensor histidine kinase PleC